MRAVTKRNKKLLVKITELDTPSMGWELLRFAEVGGECLPRFAEGMDGNGQEEKRKDYDYVRFNGAGSGNLTFLAS